MYGAVFATFLAGVGFCSSLLKNWNLAGLISYILTFCILFGVCIFSQETAQQIAWVWVTILFLSEQSRSNCFRLVVVIGCNGCLIFPAFCRKLGDVRMTSHPAFCVSFLLLLFDNPSSFCPFLILNTCFFLKKAFGRSFVEAIFRWRYMYLSLFFVDLRPIVCVLALLSVVIKMKQKSLFA